MYFQPHKKVTLLVRIVERRGGCCYSELYINPDSWQPLGQPIGYPCFTHNLDCDKTVENISFQDTIKHWESLDSLGKVFNAANRILNYNPEDVEAMKALAGYYSAKAVAGITQYYKLRADIKEKKESI